MIGGGVAAACCKERLINYYPFGGFWDLKGPARVQSHFCVSYCLGGCVVTGPIYLPQNSKNVTAAGSSVTHNSLQLLLPAYDMTIYYYDEEAQRGP